MSDSNTPDDAPDPDASLFGEPRLTETFEDPYSGEERAVTVRDISENELRYHARVAEQRVEDEDADIDDPDLAYELALWEEYLVAVDGDDSLADRDPSEQPSQGREAVVEAMLRAWGMIENDLDELIGVLQDQGN